MGITTAQEWLYLVEMAYKLGRLAASSGSQLTIAPFQLGSSELRQCSRSLPSTLTLRDQAESCGVHAVPEPARPPKLGLLIPVG